ncbi:zeta toxin family protein [Polaromonas sp.]|nr:zeta toxin family protein [Candidatus Saccharibacteria bacterium]
MTPAIWAREHKSEIVNRFFKRTNYTGSVPPIGIFMAGVPGAGKTEFTKQLMRELIESPLRIDMDEIAETIEGYQPAVAHAFREAATIILDRIYDKALRLKKDFIFDGTFGHSKALENIRRARKKSYTVKVYVIYQDPVIAWSFTKDREVIELRKISKEGFINSYFNIITNIKELQNDKQDVIISLILKDSSNLAGVTYENVEDIFDYLPDIRTREYLESAIIV